jgi:hypothetical protein
MRAGERRPALARKHCFVGARHKSNRRNIIVCFSQIEDKGMPDRDPKAPISYPLWANLVVA